MYVHVQQLSSDEITMKMNVQGEEFKLIGKLVATSILQGGCGLPVLHPVLYHYLTTGEYMGLITRDEDVPDLQVQQLLKEVRESKVTRLL